MCGEYNYMYLTTAWPSQLISRVRSIRRRRLTTMRCTCLQVAYGDEEPVADRVERVAGLVPGSAGADLVVLPELWPHGGFSYRTWRDRAEPVDGPTDDRDREVRRRDRAPSSTPAASSSAPPRARPRPEGRGLWNTSVLLGPDGGRLASYRKIHRFGFGNGEPALLEAGDELVVTDPSTSPAGAPTVRLGHLLRPALPGAVPRPAGRRRAAGVVPAAWPARPGGRRGRCWAGPGRSRTSWSSSSATPAGTHAGVRWAATARWSTRPGRVLAEAGDGEEVLVVDVDLAAVDAWREAFPVLADRRL